MSNKFLLQASVFMILALASGWIYLNNISYNEPQAQGIPDSYTVDLKSPEAIKEAISKAEEEVKELDVKIDDLKTEMNELADHKTFLSRFITSFSSLMEPTEKTTNNKSNSKMVEKQKSIVRAENDETNITDRNANKPGTDNRISLNNRASDLRDTTALDKDVTARLAEKSKLFSRLPSEVQDLVFDVEEQTGQPMVNLNRHDNMVQADFNGNVFIKQIKSGRYIVPEFIVDAFSEISLALGGIYKISNIVISSPKESGQKDRLLQFIKTYLGDIKDQVEVQETDASSDLQFSIYYKDL